MSRLDGCCADVRAELSFYTVPGLDLIGLGNVVPSRVNVGKSAVESLVR